MSGNGRSSQDGFYLKEIGRPVECAKRLGRLIEQERLRAGMTQGQFVECAGMTQAALSLLERGGSNPTVKTLERIAEALGKRLVITFE